MAIIRLDKMLSLSGIGSRNDVKKLIRQGKIFVDGNKVSSGKIKIDTEKNSIVFDKNEIIYKKYIYLIMNKPKGVICATIDKKDKTIIDIISDNYKKIPLFPVGRLDKDTVGLIILTNDGAFAHNTLSPKKHIEKEYFAIVSGQVDINDIEAFKNGIKIDNNYICKSSELNIIKSDNFQSSVTIKISEGKFHQIKKMFKAIGKEVIFLKRISFGGIKLDDSLKEGEYREINEKEYNILKKFMEVDN